VRLEELDFDTTEALGLDGTGRSGLTAWGPAMVGHLRGTDRVIVGVTLTRDQYRKIREGSHQ
jgi:hypothetical protein